MRGIEKLPYPCWIAWLICLLIAEAQAAPRSQEGDCLITTDFYIVHFTAFQPPSGGTGDARQRREEFRRYCRELPQTGVTYFGIDFMDRDVRHLPIALRVVEERGEGEAGEVMRTLKEIPPRPYPQGVAALKVDFDRPGHYALVVQFGEAELADDRLRIPLTVGLSSFPIPWLPIAAAISLVLFFSMIGFFVLRFRRGGSERKSTAA